MIAISLKKIKINKILEAKVGVCTSIRCCARNDNEN
jgi:hypothetical protein